MDTKIDAVAGTLDAFEKCLIRMERRGFIRDEAYLCKLILKAISFVCNQMAHDQFPDERTFSDAMSAIGEAIRAYNETDDQIMVKGVIEGMQAMSGFDTIKSSVMCRLAREEAIQDASRRSDHAEKHSLCDIPISPTHNAFENLVYQIDHENFKHSHILYPSRNSSVRSDVFIAIWDMLETIVKGTDWQKKARIVLEYDPQESKMELTTYQTTDEEQTTEDR